MLTISSQITAIETALEGILQALRKAFHLKNCDIIGRFLADDFQYFSPTGERLDREGYKKRLLSFFEKVSEFLVTFKNIAVHAFEQVGWVTYIEHINYVLKGEPRKRKFLVTVIFEKRDFKWMVVHLHISKVLSRRETLSPGTTVKF